MTCCRHYASNSRVFLGYMAICCLCLQVQCGRPVIEHLHIGSGGATPESTWALWLRAFEQKDYSVVRELMRFEKVACGGMALIALDPTDTEAIDLFLRDHRDVSPKSMGNPHSALYQEGQSFHARFEELWQIRIAKYRDALLPHLVRFQNTQPLQQDENTFLIEYPRACFNESGQLLGFDQTQTNHLIVKRYQGRWFITDFSCHAMNEGSCLAK